jgi:hypothetical protein
MSRKGGKCNFRVEKRRRFEYGVWTNIKNPGFSLVKEDNKKKEIT